MQTVPMELQPLKQALDGDVPRHAQQQKQAHPLDDDAEAPHSDQTHKGSSSTSHQDPGSHHPSDQHALLLAAERKTSWRVLPLLVSLVLVSFIDRSNLAFASLQMSADLGLSTATYGLGSGCFFLGYALLQVPSNALLLLFGGPLWLSAITVAWGICATCFAAIQGTASFLALRLLLGVFESGAIPGAWHYLSTFYPADRLVLPYSIMETGSSVSQVIAAPLAAGLLSLDGVLGLRGWQWVFLVEGMPALLLGVLLRFFLPRDVRSAPFFTHAEKGALQKAMRDHRVAGPKPPPLHAPTRSSSASDGLVTTSQDGTQRTRQQQQQQRHEHQQHDQQKQPRHTGQHQQQEPDCQKQEQQRHQQLQQQQALPTETQLLLASGASSHLPMHSSPRQGKHVQSHDRSHDPHDLHDDQSSNRITFSAFRRVLRNRIVLYAGAWRILHDMPSYAAFFFLPMLVNAVLGNPVPGAPGAAGGVSAPVAASAEPTAAPPDAGVLVVLLTAIPFTSASVFHLANAYHAQHRGKRRLHITASWLIGALALLLMPISMRSWGPVPSFCLLTIVVTGLNAANGIQTSLVASLLTGPQRALGLATYNSIGSIGGFVGPYAVGLLHDWQGSYDLAMVVMGVSLAGAALMVYLFPGRAWVVEEAVQGSTDVSTAVDADVDGAHGEEQEGHIAVPVQHNGYSRVEA